MAFCSTLIVSNRPPHVTCRENVIRAWWQRYPDANIGVWLRRSGLICIDVDVDDGKRGREQIAALEKKYGPMPRTCHQRSASGGEHFIMRDPWGDPTSTDRVVAHLDGHKHVDVKSNGYVLLAPSKTASGEYRWKTEGHTSPMPSRWVDALNRAIVRTKPEGVGDVEAWRESVDTGFDRATLPAMLNELASRAGRTEATTMQAIVLVFEKAGYGLDEGTPILDVHYNQRRATPYDARGLDRQIQRVGEKEAGRGARWRVIVKPKAPIEVPTPTVETPTRRLTGLVPLSEVESERLTWLWSQRIPFGKVTILDGAPGEGKSTMMTDVAARVSRGARMPEDGHPPRPPADVIMLSTMEDGAGDTIRPRADAANADVTRIHLWITTVKGGDDPPSLPTDVEILRQLIVEKSAVLVIIDPWVAYLDDGVNTHNDHEVRRALAPLQRIADDTKAAIVLVRHLRKSGGTATQAGGGAVGIIGAARGGLLVAPDTSDETGDTKVVAMTKTNVSRKASSLKFRIVSADNGVGRVEWMGTSELTADQLLEKEPKERAAPKTDACVDWLRRMLEDGAKDHKEVEMAAQSYGHTDKVLRSARERLGVTVERYGKGHTRWALPVAETPTQRDESKEST